MFSLLKIDYKDTENIRNNHKHHKEKIMITLTAAMQAAEGKEKELETVFAELVKGTATEQGAVEYRLHRVLDKPGKYRFMEKFKDQDAFDFHSNSEHFKTAIEKITSLTVEVEMEMLELIDSIPEK